jgi:hypothetical protein
MLLLGAVGGAWGTDSYFRFSATTDAHILQWNIDDHGYDSSARILGVSVADANTWGANAYFFLGDMATIDSQEVDYGWDTIKLFDNKYFGIIGNHDLNERYHAWPNDTFLHNSITGTYAPQIKTDTVLSTDGSLSLRIFVLDQNYYGGYYTHTIPGKNIGDRIGLNQYTYDSLWQIKYMCPSSQYDWISDTLAADVTSDGIIVLYHVIPDGTFIGSQELLDTIRNDKLQRPCIILSGHDHVFGTYKAFTTDSSRYFRCYKIPSVQTFWNYNRFMFVLDGTGANSVLKPLYLSSKKYVDTAGLTPITTPLQSLSDSLENLYVTNVADYDTSIAGGNWSTAANWSKGTIPYPNDTALFDSKQTANDTVDKYFDVAKLIITADNARDHVYTGTSNWTKYGYSNDGTGATKFGNRLYNTISGIIHLGVGIGTPVTALCTLQVAGSTTLDIDKASTLWSSIVVDHKSTCVVSGAASTLTINGQGARCLTVGDTSTFTLTQYSQFSPKKDGPIFAWGRGVTFNGTGGWAIKPGANGMTISVPATTYSGSGGVYMIDWGASTFDGTIKFTGNQSYGSNQIYAYAATAGVMMVLNLNGYNLLCGALSWGANNVAGSWTSLCGSGTINASSYAGHTYNGAAATVLINWNTVTRNITGNYQNGSNHTYLDTGTINFTGTTAATFTTWRKPHYNVTVNKTTNGMTTNGVLVCNGTFTLTDGTFAQNAATDTVYAINAIVNTTDAVTNTAPWNISNKLQVAAGLTLTLPDLIIGTGDGGSARSLDSLVSSVAGSTATLDLGGDTITVTYFYAKDIIVTNGLIIASDGTSVNGGNTTGITWPSSGGRHNRGWLGLGLWIRP